MNSQRYKNRVSDNPAKKWIQSKKIKNNSCTGNLLFHVGDKNRIQRNHFWLIVFMTVLKYIPRSRWFSTKKAVYFPDMKNHLIPKLI